MLNSKFNFRKGWETNRKIRGSDVDYILSQDTLQRWAGYSLQRRCDCLLRERNLSVHPKTLAHFYHKNKIRYVVVHWQYS